MAKIVIVGALAATNGITLFKDDGSSLVLPQDNWRTADIMGSVMPALAASQRAEIDLTEFSLATKIEKAMGGKVKAKEDESGKVTLMAGAAQISDASAVEQHVDEVLYGGRSAKGFKNFMRLFGKAKVKHSAEELLEFMRHADLPIADDGSIIGYKILRKGKTKDVYVDPHTRTVEQSIGSLVWMPASKVNDDRRMACSTGLHICSRSYVRNFGGDVLTLVKVKPSDVIAVPTNETSKMRASAYHIVALLPEEAYRHVREGGNLADHKAGASVLASVIAGGHAPISNRVEVGERGVFKAEKVAVKKTPAKNPSKPAALAKVEKPVGKRVEPKDVKALIVAAQQKVEATAQKPKASPDKVYDAKVAEAKKLLKKGGMSLRAVGKALGLCRDKLSRRLKNDGFLS